MLKDALYKITSSNHQEHTINAMLELNKSNEIFTGHFPGEQVLPGACMLQMVKEVLESTLNRPLRLKKADQIKFPNLINPGINNILQMAIAYSPAEGKNINVTASLSVHQNIYFKFKGTFIAL